jgi:hypothetical protein
MKKGLVVIILISSALITSSCGPSDVILLDAGDHADVVGDVIENLDVIPVLSLTGITTLTTPTVEELLSAALEVEAIGDDTKGSINITLDLLPEVEGWLAEIPDETWQAINEIMGNVTELETVPDTIDLLQEAIDSGQYDGYEWLSEALELGIDLLEAGEDTIYNPGWTPYTAEHLLSFNASQLLKEDLEGGIAGAVGAALAGAAPAQYVISIGGVVGAVDSSIADLISQLAGWW